MSEPCSYRFSLKGGKSGCLKLPFDLPSVISDWSALRSRMIARMPEEFTRDEWAYLISFLDKDSLYRPFAESFGPEAEGRSDEVVLGPRGKVAVWLPNNVSMLGPLALVLMTLTGNSVRIKTGSRNLDLTGPFVRFALDNLADGELVDILMNKVRIESFGRDDARHSEMASEANVRLVFGSDASAEAIHELPHPDTSVGFSFVDKRSIAWCEPVSMDHQMLSSLIKVFAIYGQTGCTSPSRLVLIGAGSGDAAEVCSRITEMWPKVIRGDVPVNQASANVLDRQVAAALGWDARITSRNSAVIACGDYSLPPLDGIMTLPVVPSTIEEAAANLPSNIQTIGYCFSRQNEAKMIDIMRQSGALRIVPISEMHHFSHVWDGQDFWRQSFVEYKD